MDENTLRQLGQMKDFLAKINGEYVTKDEFLQAFKIFKEVLGEMKSLMDNHFSKVNEIASSTIDGQNKNIKGIQDGFSKINTDVSSNFVSHIDNIKGEISRLEERINNSANETSNDKVDLTPLHIKISALEFKIPELTNDKAEVIRNKLESLQGDERLDKSAIKGLDESLKAIEEKASKASSPRSSGFGIPSGTMQLKDLSSQTTGSLKVFSVPKNTFGYVVGSDFPSVMFEGNGFTLNATRTQLTLTTTNAPSTNSQLAFIYSSVFNIL